MINTLHISGRLTTDPVFKVTPQEKSFVTFTIAQNVYNGKDKEDTKLFVEVTGWHEEGKRDFWQDMSDAKLVKGQELCVSGRLNLREYEGKVKLMLEYPVMHGYKAYRPKETTTSPDENGAF